MKLKKFYIHKENQIITIIFKIKNKVKKLKIIILKLKIIGKYGLNGNLIKDFGLILKIN